MDITLDPAGIANVLNEAPAVRALEGTAADVVAEAKEQGPRAEHRGKHVIDQLAVGDSHETSEGAVVDLDWPSSFWHLLEFGSVNNPPYRPVSRAAENNGLKITDGRSST